MKSLIYLGDGSNFIPGVPTRNLTADEVENLSEATRKQALASGLYVEADEKVKKEAVNG